ncbi:hypothetical protein ACRAWF_34425 [Streptomyces sp. L7]
MGDARRLAAGSEDGAEVHYTSPDGSQELCGQVLPRPRRSDADVGGLGAERPPGAGLTGRSGSSARRSAATRRWSGSTRSPSRAPPGTPGCSASTRTGSRTRSTPGTGRTWETQALKTYDKVRNSFVVL